MTSMLKAKLKSRKFWLTVLFAAITLICIFSDKVDGEIGLGILGAVFGVYSGINVLQKSNPIINGLEDRENGQ